MNKYKPGTHPHPAPQIGSLSREQILRNVVAEYERPEPVAGPAPRIGSDLLEVAGHTLKHEARAGHVRPGGVSKMVSILPPELQQKVITGTQLFNHEVELGRHGNPERVAARLGVDLETAHAVRDGFTVDYVVGALEQRKSDATLPIPDPDRRDFLRASIDAIAPNQE